MHDRFSGAAGYTKPVDTPVGIEDTRCTCMDLEHSLEQARTALPFKIGDRTYWVGRDDKRLGYRIVANGDIVEFASSLHYGEVGAFVRIAQRLSEIEKQWAV